MENGNSIKTQVAEIEIIYRNGTQPNERPKITKSQHCYELVKSIWNPDTIEYKEEFLIVLLNKGNHVLGVSKISQGGTSGCTVDRKMIFQCALKSNASSIILVHNHPSGNLNPSEQDKYITRKLMEGAVLLEVGILDHLIISPYGFYSFSDDGLI